MSAFDVARRKPNFSLRSVKVKNVLPPNLQNIAEFLCTGVVGGIDTANGWCYISCSKCTRKLQRRLSSFACTAFHDENAVELLVTVFPVHRTADFLSFDTEITKLTNLRAGEYPTTSLVASF
ncbi:hypothetical protein F2Q70_00011733 [Brassica cretica]|uniref:Replication factor A C-terminal domain-containing protein n=1 Tax=Brassica cretica TaxID=69181 RepID=A0A8S9LST8_BRACR|nr:hypothetical protein F2Q70_00011733 [Brassica cretica]